MPPPPSEGSGPSADVGRAISWAFDTFKAHAAAFVGLAAVVTVIQLVQRLGSATISNLFLNCDDVTSLDQVNACTATLGIGLVISLFISVVFGLLAFIAMIGVQRAAIQSTQGVTPSFSQMLTTDNLLKYILFVIVYGILFFVGLALCILPGIAVLFLFQLGPYYVLDKGYGVIEAMKASFEAVTKNFVPALIMTVVNALVSILGGISFGLLTLVTLPFASLFTAHMYRQFNREEIAA
jgi:uncharacterized membrane protein